ncbi:MAG: hypothetical protein ACO2ON_01695 [Candidatus Nanopusillus sp.]
MRAIGSLILKVTVVILLVIFIGILAMVLSTVFNTTSILAGVGYTAQYSAYGISYKNCLSNANFYGYNASVCDNLLNVTNNTANTLLWTGNYAGTFSNPMLWAIIFIIITAGLYVTSIQAVQFGQKITVVKTRRKRK